MSAFVVLEVSGEFDLDGVPGDGVLQMCAAGSLAGALNGIFLMRDESAEAAAQLLSQSVIRRRPAGPATLPFRRPAELVEAAAGEWLADDVVDLVPARESARAVS